MTLQFETVAIPVTKGVDLRTAARLVEPPALLEALNARFSGDGSSKRYGHTSRRVLTTSYPPDTVQVNVGSATLTPYGAKLVDADWLYGWGLMTSTDRGDGGADSWYTTSPYPEPGHLFDGLTRDYEKVAWTGHRLVSLSPGQYGTHVSTANPACMPALRSQLVAKKNAAQFHPDIADNGEVRVVVWMNNIGTSASTVYYSVFDSQTGALLVNAAALNLVNAFGARVLSLGNWFHIIGVDQDGGETLEIRSFEQSAPTTIVARTVDTMGTGNIWFDFWKVDETKAAIVYVGFTTVGETTPDVLKLTWIGPLGTLPSDELTVTLDTDSEDEFANVACAVHPVTGRVGVAFFTEAGAATADSVMACVYNRSGSQAGTLHNIDAHGGMVSASDQITIAPRYLYNSGREDFDIYASWYIATPSRVITYSWLMDTNSATQQGQIYHQMVASHAFRVGDRTFVWTGNANSTLQSTWLLLDSALAPVGHLNFGTAATHLINTALGPTLASVNWTLHSTVKDQAVFHLGLGYKQRVAATNEQQGLYTEESIQYVELDFLPKLQTVQGGRCTYIAGAQVWAYDGASLVEAGFHVAPEVTATEAAGGSLTTLGTYSYRVDLCHRNSQNEEIRSHSFIVQTTLTGANATVTLKIKTCPTRRSDAYFLIFRNAMVAAAPTSTWNLINSRNPTDASFKVNDQTQDYITYSDTGAVNDATGLTRELHPGNSSTYQHPFAAPACEIIAAGRDRVWVAGGELEPGQIAPSRLFGPGETPAWNGNLAIQIDRNEAPITAIGFVGEIAAVFRERSTYIQEGDGPDNQGNGFWPPARLALADTGAVGQESVILSSVGLLFQSPIGFRLLGPSGQLSALGEPVDPLAKDFTVNACISLPRESEIRWYGDTSTIVYNYLADAWSTWSIGARAALVSGADRTATLVQGNGFFFTETPDTYRDGDTLYEHRLRFPWLHAGSVGDFQRLKRFAGFGTWDPADGTHKIRTEIYYDERDWLEEFWEWDVPDATQNTDTWGAATWGAGTWGDTASSSFTRDSVWRWRRMPRKQKCSVFSIVISDNFTDGPGFSLVALGLELARKTGLDRIAVPGGTNVNRS